MKKIKTLLGIWITAVVAVVCSFSFAVKASAEGTVDVTSQVSASNWVDHSELKVTYLDLGAGVVPDTVDYGVIDKDHQYVQEYIAINGRTVKEINTDVSLGASEWTYTVFPASVDAKYKLPIIIYENKGKFEIKFPLIFLYLLSINFVSSTGFTISPSL